MNLEFDWKKPIKTKQNNKSVYKRECIIPMFYRNEFFKYWKVNKLNLINKGFSVYKKDKDWFLTETKNKLSDFKIKKDVDESLPEYKIKNKNGLRPWQSQAVSKLVSSIKKWGCGIDGSDVGVGKTYTACAVARELNYNIMVICPKAVKESWRRVITDHFNLEDKCIGITNYESLRTGRKDSPYASLVRNRKTNKYDFVWKIPKRTLIIWDEAQKLKNHKTKNSKTCISALKDGYKMLFCSATLATNPLELRTVGQCVQLFKNSNQYYKWAYNHGVVRGRFGLEFVNDKNSLKKLNKDIFINRGVRLSRDTIPNFPDSQIIADCYEMDKESTEKIDDIYKELHSELEKINQKQKKDKENQLTEILRAREKIELLKVPLMVDMVEEGIENNMSVVIFCNFTQTIDALSKRLNTKCIVNGKIKDKERQQNIDNFQLDRERIILIGLSAGGAGLSLHDINGKHPRLALVSPSYSAVLMRQALGRVWRDSSKSKSVQKIIFAAKTIEVEVCKSVNQKLDNLDLLNDGDLL